MSTSFYIFVNIAPQHAGAPKCVRRTLDPRLNDRRAAKLTVGTALGITNRLHFVVSMLIMHAYLVNNK
jgi:hypothetical protein